MSETEKVDDDEAFMLSSNAIPNRNLTYEITINIMAYLNARDLCESASVSKAFRTVTYDPFLWHRLIINDFNCVSIHDIESGKSKYNNPRSAYALSLATRRSRIIDAKTRHIQLTRAKKQEKKQYRMGIILDIIHIRSLALLTCVSPFISLILIGRWIDGTLSNSSYWTVMIPMWILYLVISVAAASGIIMWMKKNNGASLYRDMYQGMRGAIWFFIHQVCEEHLPGILSGVLGLSLSLLFLVVLGFKLQGDLSCSWYLVFSPIWVIFALISLSPCLQCRTAEEPICYVLGLILCWTPFLSSALMLASYLDSGYPNLTMVFTPLWIVEGVFVAAALIFFTCFIYRKISPNGLDRSEVSYSSMDLSVSLLGFFGVLALFIPLVIFKVLVVLYVQQEESGGGRLNASIVLTPLIVFCSLFLPVVAGIAVTYTTRHRPTALRWIDNNPLHFPAPLVREGRWNSANRDFSLFLSNLDGRVESMLHIGDSDFEDL